MPEPELGLDTPKTLAKVRAELDDLPLEWREGPSCTGAARSAPMAEKAGEKAVLLLRGNGRAPCPKRRVWISRRQCLAECTPAGTIHTAMLVRGGPILAGPGPRQGAGEVRFMFQPGEEGYPRRPPHDRGWAARSPSRTPLSPSTSCPTRRLRDHWQQRRNPARVRGHARSRS